MECRSRNAATRTETRRLAKFRGTTGDRPRKELLLGWNTAQFRIWDGVRALDYLVSRSDVDARRVGVLGLSGGGTLSAYLNALENRFCAAAPAGFLSTIRDARKTWQLPPDIFAA